MKKSLDAKLAAIHKDPGCREFIIADAKDADMALGIGAPGQSPETHSGELRFRTLEEYREQMRLITRSGVGRHHAHVSEYKLCVNVSRALFDDSPVTPAVRANDTTDIHLARGAAYHEEPSRPFRTASIDHIQCGHIDCAPEERGKGANLGLYSVTFNNNLERDLETLQRFRDFREEAERKGFRYFLEVFDSNMPGAVKAEALPGYTNDMIARMLAGVAPAGTAVVPEDGLSRTEGDGRACSVRRAPGRRHSGRISGHDPRRVPASVRRTEVRGEGGAVRAQDQ